jgi:hypothetical protein
MEQYYVFLKGNRVMDIAVFASKDEELADTVAQNQKYDDAIWVGDNKPQMYSTWDGSIFTDPTIDDLFELGITDENTAMRDARLAEEAARKARLSEPSV